MRTLTWLVIGAAGFITGLATMRISHRSGDEARGADVLPAVSGRTARSGGDAAESLQAANNLAAYRNHYLSFFSENPELRREMERLGVPELRGLIDDVVKDLDAPSGEIGPLKETLESAIAELVRRQGEEAIEWLAAHEPARLRRGFLEQAIKTLAGESPVVAKPWIERHRKDYGDDSIDGILSAAVAGATARGADELIKVYGLFADDLRGSGTRHGYPDDFDFALFYTAMAGKINLQEMVAQWGSVDKEAGWNAIRKGIDPGKPGSSLNIGDLVKGVIAREGDVKGATWAAAKVAELPAESQNQALRWLGSVGRLSRPAIATVLDSLSNADRRANFASALIKPVTNGGTDRFLMERLSPRERSAALEIAAGNHSFAVIHSPDHSQGILDYFAEAGETWQLSPADREAVTKALHTPKRRR